MLHFACKRAVSAHCLGRDYDAECGGRHEGQQDVTACTSFSRLLVSFSLFHRNPSRSRRTQVRRDRMARHLGQSSPQTSPALDSVSGDSGDILFNCRDGYRKQGESTTPPPQFSIKTLSPVSVLHVPTTQQVATWDTSLSELVGPQRTTIT